MIVFASNWDNTVCCFMSLMDVGRRRIIPYQGREWGMCERRRWRSWTMHKLSQSWYAPVIERYQELLFLNSWITLALLANLRKCQIVTWIRSAQRRWRWCYNIIIGGTIIIIWRCVPVSLDFLIIIKSSLGWEVHRGGDGGEKCEEGHGEVCLIKTQSDQECLGRRIHHHIMIILWSI